MQLSVSEVRATWQEGGAIWRPRRVFQVGLRYFSMLLAMVCSCMLLVPS